ncbi:MAG: hypothetical protein COV46_02985 [Deltaproteobacteria bacterium CG11_big_fil_rev_8_21_14_0_20_49_13]|nr:MAG: hypothetical protein COV46_02985 [Deltaproteobacteria bacterium CG11_big_fil_rev_8_21_14_0_20_49_13]
MIRKLFIRIKANLKPIVIFVAAAGFVWFAVFGDQGLWNLKRAIGLRKELTARETELRARINELKENKNLLTNKEHLELVIRQELGYVKDGEIVFQQMSP